MSKMDFGGSYKRIVQAFWDPEPKNDDPTTPPIWCRGKQYSAKRMSNGTHSESASKPGETQKLTNGEIPTNSAESSETQKDSASSKTAEIQPNTIDQSWPPEFLDDCESLAWFTYRSSFPSIQKSSEASMTLSVRLRSLGDQGGFTSDTGWGCMIRSGQSLLANALFTLRLGREWRRGQKQEQEREILSLFADYPESPFSIHRFVEHGATACGKHPGEWFGPSATARCIQALCEDYEEAGLKVYMNGDGADVYEDRVFNLAKSKSKTNTFTPILILVQIRLGIDRVTPVYWDGLRDTLRLPQSVGIAGGRPSSSHYFFAFQGDQVFYLDPHFTRPALPFYSNVSKYSTDEIDSCHTRRLRRIPLRDMDPSMLIAFLIKDEEDWRSWRQAVGRTSGKPVVHVADEDPQLHRSGAERSSAMDEVETLDDEDADGDDELEGSGGSSGVVSDI